MTEFLEFLIYYDLILSNIVSIDINNVLPILDVALVTSFINFG